jgi:proline racemase
LDIVMTRYKTIDAHVAGEAVRLVIEGAPTVKGRTMMEKLAWLRKHGEPLRKALMLEPRGHAGMHGALFTEPVSTKAHAGLLCMNAGGFPLVSGETAMAAVTIALEQKIIHVESDDLYIDTPAGLVTVRPKHSEIAISGLRGFVHAGALPVRFGNRNVLVDVAFGGQFFAIADSEAVGISVDSDHAPELVRAAARLQHAVDNTLHATNPNLNRLDGVIFTAPPRQGGDLRTATVLDGGVLHRSPGVTATIAVMAVLDAMGIIAEAHRFINEGVIGTSIAGSVLTRDHVDDVPVILPLVEATVSITGHHEFLVENSLISFKI